MANERLTLEIAAQASGQDAIDRLTTAMNRYSAAAEAAGSRGSAGFSKTAQAVKEAGDAAEQSAVKWNKLGFAIKDVFEGRTGFAAVEGGYFLSSLGGLALGAGVAAAAMYALYKHFDPIADAQKRSAESTKDFDKEIQQLGRDLQNLNFANLEKAIGKGPTDAFRANSLAARVQADRNLLGASGIDIAEFQRRIKVDTISGPFGTNIGRAGQAAQIDLRAAQERQFTLTLQLQKDQQDQSDFLTASSEHQQDITDQANQKRQEKEQQAADKLAEQRKRAQSIVDSETERHIRDSLARSYYSTNARLAGFDDPQSRKMVTGAGISEIQSAAYELQRKAADDTQKGYAESITKGQKDFVEALQLSTKELENQSAAYKKVADIQDSITRQNGESAVRRLTSGSAFTDKMIGLNPGLSDAGKFSLTQSNDLATAAQRYAIEKEIASEYMDEKKRADALNEAELNHELALQQIKEDGIEKIAELQNKQLQDFTQTIGTLYNAVMDRSRNPTALRDFVRSQAMGFGQTIVENVAKQAVYPALQQATGSLHVEGSLGKIFSGTMFGPDPMKALGKGPTGTLADPVYVKVPGVNPGTAASGSAGLPASISGGTGGAYGTVDGSGTPVGLDGLPISLSQNPTAGIPFSSSTYSSTMLSSLSTSMTPKALSSLASSFGNFSTGAASVLSGNALSILFGQNTTGPTTLSAQIGAGVGLAGAAAAGTMGVMSGLKQGGVGGDLKAAGSAAGMAGALVSNISKLIGAASPLLSAIPIVGSIAAMALPLIGGLLNGPAQRATAISNELGSAQYIAPTALNVSESSGGTFADFGYKGNLRNSNLSPYPQVNEGYVWTQTHGLLGSPANTYYDVPGGQTSQYGAPVAQQPPTVINVSAMDVQSFADFAQRNHAAIGAAAATNLQSVHGSFSREVAPAARNS